MNILWRSRANYDKGFVSYLGCQMIETVRLTKEDAEMAETLEMTPAEYYKYKSRIMAERPTVAMLEEFLCDHRNGKRIKDKDVDMAEEIMIALRTMGWKLDAS